MCVFGDSEMCKSYKSMLSHAVVRPRDQRFVWTLSWPVPSHCPVGRSFHCSSYLWISSEFRVYKAWRCSLEETQALRHWGLLHVNKNVDFCWAHDGIFFVFFLFDLFKTAVLQFSLKTDTTTYLLNAVWIMGLMCCWVESSAWTILSPLIFE